MERLDEILVMFDSMLNSKRKRHIVGGRVIECIFIIWRIGIYCHEY
jgi:hypothetical protein